MGNRDAATAIPVSEVPQVALDRAVAVAGARGVEVTDQLGARVAERGRGRDVGRGSSSDESRVQEQVGRAVLSASPMEGDGIRRGVVLECLGNLARGGRGALSQVEGNGTGHVRR